MVRTSFLERSGSYPSWNCNYPKNSQKGGHQAFKKSTRDNCHFSAEVKSWRYRVHSYLFHSSWNPIDVAQSSSKKSTWSAFSTVAKKLESELVRAKTFSYTPQYLESCVGMFYSVRKDSRVSSRVTAHILIGWIDFIHLLQIRWSITVL